MGEWTADEQREHRKIWVAALRSGKYRQVRGALSDKGGMCCLGVACEISNLGEWNNGGGYRAAADYHYSILPPEVKDWLGLRTEDGRCGIHDSRQLSAMNDAGTPFSVIADVIDDEPEGLLSQAEAAS